MNGPQIYFEIPSIGFQLTETMINSWVVMGIILIICLFLSHNLQKYPKGKQVLAEMFVKIIDNLVESNMGKGCSAYAPFIAALMMSSLFGSLCSLIGLRSVTADLNTTLGWALIVFALITYSKFRAGGPGGYFKGFLQPIFVMAPINVLSEIATPVSMSFRHFGNIAGGLVISTLLLRALAALSTLLHLPIPLFQIGLPGVLSLYFDLFTACMQAFIFSMLTMAYVGSAREG